MWIETLHVAGLRSLADLKLRFPPGINVLIGRNGAGKTSVLEAIFLLSHARSFRSGSWETLLRRGADGLHVYAELGDQAGRTTRLGLGRRAENWQAKKNGESVSIGEFVSACAVVCCAPGSHVLIDGLSEDRRRFLDWGVFHVEQSFSFEWRRYQRALKQRNTLLRGTDASPSLLRVWEMELANAAERIDQFRRAYVNQLTTTLSSILDRLLPELGASALYYKRGWSEQQNLSEAYELGRIGDIKRMYTTLGAHRADWSIVFERAPRRENLSRGQAKLVTLACTLAQASLFTRQRGEAPIICLDDLASELDPQHQNVVLEHLSGYSAQMFITGTYAPDSLKSMPHTLFHVEQRDAGTVLL